MQLSVVSKEQTFERPAADHASAAQLCVLKFGSSVLRTIDDLPRVAGEIYRQRRAGRQVVAVVSALAGETDALFAQAAAVAGGTCCQSIADLVSLGEERTAALLRIACDRIGIPTAICRPEELRLHTKGDARSATPVHLLGAALKQKLDKTGVAIVPGFVGVDCADGHRTLLGRGGSDLSAVFLAAELGADRLCLYKDVDGVYDSDPALNQSARHFAQISWNDAARVAGKLIQPQAIALAAERGIDINVASIGGSESTRVGACTTAAEPARPQRPLRIALAGYGVVGQALAARVAKEPGFEIVSILVRDLGRSRKIASPCPLTDDLTAFKAVPADILIDALSCDATGRQLCEARLSEGVHIASASKRVISSGHARLSQIAGEEGAHLLYSAAVGGAAPILETVARARQSGDIVEISATLNGTVNFILERLAAGADFAEALEEARRAGFAEEDSSADLSGADAAAKLRLVAATAFNADPEHVYVDVEPLDEALATRIRASGKRWVQIAAISGEQASVSIRPAEEAAPLPVLGDEWNAARVTLADGHIFSCLGRGAGGAATAEAIVADLFTIQTATAC